MARQCKVVKSQVKILHENEHGTADEINRGARLEQPLKGPKML